MSQNLELITSDTVGIVVPIYNGSKYLAASLASIKGQTHRDFRCTLIDDGSSDESLAIATDFAREDQRFLVRRQANGGPGAARNAGYKALISQWPGISQITFFDADDLWHQDACEVLLGLIQAHPDVAAAYALGRDIDESGAVLLGEPRENWMRHRRGVYGRSIKTVPPEEPTTFSIMVYAPCVVNCGVMIIRSEAFERLGGFERSLRGPEDWDLWIRLSRISNLPWIDRVILDYRKHGAGVSSNRRRVVKAVQSVRWRAINDISNTLEQRRQAKLAYRSFYAEMAKSRYHDFCVNFDKQLLKLFAANKLMSLVGRPLLTSREPCSRFCGTLESDPCPTSA